MKYCGKCDNGWVPGFLGAMKIPCECTKQPLVMHVHDEIAVPAPDGVHYPHGAVAEMLAEQRSKHPADVELGDSYHDGDLPTEVDKWREAKLDGRRRRADQLIPGLNNAFQGLAVDKFLERCSPADLESAEALQKRWLEEFPQTRWFFESPEDLRRRAEKLRDRLRESKCEQERLVKEIIEGHRPPQLEYEGYFRIKVLSHEKGRPFLVYQIVEVLESEADEQLTNRVYRFPRMPRLFDRATVGTELMLRTRKRVTKHGHPFTHHIFLRPKPTVETGRALDQLIVDGMLNIRGQEAALRSYGWEWVPAKMVAIGRARGGWTHAVKDDCFELQTGRTVATRNAFKTEKRRARERLETSQKHRENAKTHNFFREA